MDEPNSSPHRPVIAPRQSTSESSENPSDQSVPESVPSSPHFSMELFSSTPRPSTPQEKTGCCQRAAPEPELLLGSEANVAVESTRELIPPPVAEDARKICLVLDLDETLIHSCFVPIQNPDFEFSFGPDDNQVPVFVLVRPGARQFLQELGALYELVVFTASVRAYADRVVDFIDPQGVVKFRLYRDSCTDFGGSFVKDLSRLNRNLNRVIIVDNTPGAYLLHPYNAIAISSWFDDPTDTALFKLLYFLKNSFRVRNVYDLLGSQ